MATTRQVRAKVEAVLVVLKDTEVVPADHGALLVHGDYDLGTPWLLFLITPDGTRRPFPGCAEGGVLGHSRSEAHAVLSTIYTGCLTGG